MIFETFKNSHVWNRSWAIVCWNVEVWGAKACQSCISHQELFKYSLAKSASIPPRTSLSEFGSDSTHLFMCLLSSQFKKIRNARDKNPAAPHWSSWNYAICEIEFAVASCGSAQRHGASSSHATEKRLGDLSTESRQTSQGSVSTIWTFQIARVGAFFSIFRYLQDKHSFALLQN